LKISYYNIGCKVNFAEISEIQKRLEEKGHSTVNFGEPTDAVIINTCTVTNHADSDARKIIRRALRLSPEAFVGVLGCYAQLKPDEIAQIEGVDAVFGMKEKFDVINYIDKISKKHKPEILVSDLKDLPFHTAASEDNENRTRIFMKLQDGCDYPCTYCTIPAARGGSRSMAFDELKSRFLELNTTNKYEIILSGVNLGEYLAPTGENFTDVIRFLDEAGLKQRIRISSIEPNLIKPELLQIINNSKTICPHLHIPLQSGSPEILALMKRRYKADFFSEQILKIKEMMPHACIGVDVISGFPGETDKHFAETIDLIKSLPISYIHAFTFSERSGTPAATMQGKVESDTRKSRTIELRKLSEEKKREFFESQTGSVYSVIPEDYNPETGHWSGWTENYVRVEYPAEENIEIKPYKVKLLKILEETVLGEKQ
jgi:threonylcarbamoyladenosine tRNA methylthiotransferase MtaB